MAFVAQLMTAVAAAPVAGSPEVVRLRKFAGTLEQIASSDAQARERCPVFKKKDYN